MKMARGIAALCHRRDQLVRNILRMAGHKAQAEIAVNLRDLLDQLRKAASARKGVDVLPEQSHILGACSNHIAHLIEHKMIVAAALSVAHIGHDAVRAKIVAAVHNADPRLGAARAQDRHALTNLTSCFADVEAAAMPVKHLTEVFREAVEHGRFKRKIHIGITVFQLLHAMRLRRHAAADRDDKLAVLCFEMLILPDRRERLLLGMLTDGAGVDHDQIGVFYVIGDRIAHFRRHAAQLFRVRLVLLAAEGHDRGAARTPRVPLPDRLYVFVHRYPLHN